MRLSQRSQVALKRLFSVAAGFSLRHPLTAIWYHPPVTAWSTDHLIKVGARVSYPRMGARKVLNITS
jgi:hypothetical protein